MKNRNKSINIKKIKSKFYFFDENNKKISPWHDISLKYNKNLYNFICEIPKWSRAKFEINKELKHNPIVQDIEDGKPRFYKWGDVYFNYGAFPQTWEDPRIKSKYTNKYGDDDPLDVIEIGMNRIEIGEVIPVKILGIIPLIDSNETDWKVIVISKNDILYNKINNIKDLEKRIPGLLPAILNWLVKYKTVTKNTLNAIAMNGKIGSKKLALEIIEETNDAWKNKFLNH